MIMYTASPIQQQYSVEGSITSLEFETISAFPVIIVPAVAGKVIVVDSFFVNTEIINTGSIGNIIIGSVDVISLALSFGLSKIFGAQYLMQIANTLGIPTNPIIGVFPAVILKSSLNNIIQNVALNDDLVVTADFNGGGTTDIPTFTYKCIYHLE